MLPVLPILFAGGATGGRRRPYAIIAGLVTSFATFTLFATWLLRQLDLPQDFLRNISIALLFLVAASLIFPQVGGAGSSGRWHDSAGVPPTATWAAASCSARASGWSSSPAAVRSSARSRRTRRRVHFGWQTVAITVAYALGAALPMLAIAALGQRATRRIRANAQALRIGPRRRPGAGRARARLQRRHEAADLVPRLHARAARDASAARSHENELAKLAAPRHLPASTAQTAADELPDYGTAPDFAGISDWLNSKPLTLQRLRGKVVLVDFWTYSCINCLRTLPHLETWDKRYRKAGLVIVGVHTPEFAFEHVPSNVREATRKLGVRYPVAIDDGYGTWNAYRNHSWPAEYLIDKRGHVREIKKGEGEYDETERSIRTLLGEPAKRPARVGQATTRRSASDDARVVPRLGAARPLRRLAGSRRTLPRPTASRARSRSTTSPTRGVWTVERQRIVGRARRAPATALPRAERLPRARAATAACR